jgi:hypothetical protein
MAIAEADKKSPVFDFEAGEFVLDSQNNVKLAYGKDALPNIIIKASSTPRGVYSVYANVDKPELDHKYGSDVEEIATHRELSTQARLSELKRAVTESLEYDTWIESVDSVEVKTQGTDGVLISANLSTIFDDEPLEVKGVKV